MLNKSTSRITSEDAKRVSKIALEKRTVTLAQLHTSSNGLTTEQADEIREKMGSNEIVSKKKNTKLKLFIEAFTTPFNLVLFFLAILSLFVNYIFAPSNEKDLSIVIVMLIMVFISGMILFIQNVRSDKAMQKLLRMVSVTTNVRRDGNDQEIPTKDVVVGDIINVSAGDMVPADMKLLSSRDLFCSSGTLTGDSAPIEKMANSVPVSSNGNLLEYPNILFEGTTIVSGSGKGVVFSTGSHTLFGKLVAEIADDQLKQTSFDIEVQKISRVLLIAVAVLTPIILVINGVTKGDWIEALFFAVATAVGITPNMLPAIMKTSLIKGSVEMGKNDSVVRRMNSLQKMGSFDVLCIDKTGILTQGRVALERHYDLTLHETPRVLTMAYLNAHYQTGMNSLMDQAIIKSARQELDINEIQRDYHKIDEIPFDFNRRRMSVVVADSDQKHGQHLLVTKGAAEEMLPISSKVEINGVTLPLTETRKEKILEKIDDLNSDGMRVMVLAYKLDPAPVGEFSAEDENNMILCGFLAFLDPPKETAKTALSDLKNKGVTVKILTEDNEAVTRAVGLGVGINVDTVYSESDIVDKSDEELSQMIEECDIFVKLSPKSKTRIIQAIQANGHMVGYLGDGINDEPAMKDADVAISVDSGVDITKETADVILLKKDLNVLLQSVQIARKTMTNAMKYIKITVSSSFSTALSILIASIALPFLPIHPLQLLILELFYAISCLSIPFDNVSESYLQKTREWSTKNMPKFTFLFGTLQAAFNVITFCLLYYVICPELVGADYASLSKIQQSVFATVFSTGWYIELLWIQELAIHALREEGIPFVRQSSSIAVLIATLGIALVGTMLPFTSFSGAMRFTWVDRQFFWNLVVILLCYIAIITIAKKFYMRKEKFLI